MDEMIYEQFTHLDEGLSGHKVTIMASSSTATSVVRRRNPGSYCGSHPGAQQEMGYTLLDMGRPINQTLTDHTSHTAGWWRQENILSRCLLGIRYMFSEQTCSFFKEQVTTGASSGILYQPGYIRTPN